MGNNLGTQEHKRKFTDTEIKKNMRVLFENNKHNPVETSYSLGENLEVSTEKKASIGGYNKIKFESSRNRHLTHNMDAFLKQQNGGGRKRQNEDVLNNFNKIKDYLMNDLDSSMKEEQYGGNFSDAGSFSFSFDSSDDSQNNFSFFGALMGGNVDADTSSLETTTKLSDSDDSSSSSSDSSSSGSTESDNTLESSELDTTTTNNSSTISNTSPVTETLPSKRDLTETSYTTSTRADEPFIVQSTESSIDTSITMNEHTGGSESSELNIVPFYSSETSNKHPYVSRRFK